MVVRLIVFLSSANLICRSTDISKCFIESLGFRDNKSRLYMFWSKIVKKGFKCTHNICLSAKFHRCGSNEYLQDRFWSKSMMMIMMMMIVIGCFMSLAPLFMSYRDDEKVTMERLCAMKYCAVMRWIMLPAGFEPGTLVIRSWEC